MEQNLVGSESGKCGTTCLPTTIVSVS
jgi:hypothetical protein